MSTGTGSLRFDPPPLRSTPDLAWVLVRAFASPDLDAPRPTDPRHAIALARDLDLLGRIASRVSAARLSAETGDAARKAAFDERHRVAASTLRILRTAERVAEAADAAGIPIVFLKGAALHLSETALVSARSASDVDVLPPADHAAGLRQALLDRGFRPRGTTRSQHHLAPVGQGDDPWVEVHTEVPGVVVPGRAGSMTFQALDSNGLLSPVGALPGHARVPVPAVLAAHALVHGIEDHGFGADRYPLLRMACDLADVLASPPSVESQVSRYVGDAVSPVELQAALSLVDRLAQGDPSVVGDRTPAGILLAHLVAGSLDADYREALRLRQLAFLLRHRSFGFAMDKLGRRLDALSPEPGPMRAWNAARLLARLVLAESRIRRRIRAG